MSSTAFKTSLDLSLRPSVRAVVAASLLHMAAIVLVVLAQLPKWAALVMTLLLLASWMTLRRHAAFGYGPRALQRLVLHSEGGWTVESPRDGRQDAELLGSSVVQSWIIVLNFRLKQGGTRSRVLAGDELDGEALRRLRARLQSN
ncbi:MAG TPA: protein YgfX [Nevskia sp.]|nr:protein YgfX [Nevskia sp.]